MPTGPEWIQITTLITACISAVVTSVVGVYLAVKTSQLKEEQAAATVKQDAADQKLTKIEVHTNSLTQRLEEAARIAGEAEGVDKEKARALAAAALIALGTLAEKNKQQSIVAPVPTVPTGISRVAANVEVVKEDVGIVKSDVKEVKSEVVKDVRKGVGEAIKETVKKLLPKTKRK